MGAEQDVAGLDVAVHQAFLVRGVQGTRDALKDVCRALELHPALGADKLTEMLAGHVAHRDVEMPFSSPAS